MSPTVTTSRYLADPSEQQFDLLATEQTRVLGPRRHLDELAEAIDRALLIDAWRDDRTSFAAPEVIAALPGASAVEPATAPLALATFERIRDLLGLDDQSAAALVGISRNTPRHWRRGDRPKAATTRHLYEVAGVLDLIATVENSMSRWARQSSPDGRPWLEIAAGRGGPSLILDHYRERVLTPRPLDRLVLAEEAEADLVDAGAAPGVPGPMVERRQGSRRRPR